MTDVRLQPPFDREFLRTIVANRLASEGDDLSHTAEWLLGLNDSDRMTEAVREAWRKSGLPLREMFHSK